jgi:uncharacterized tellurite resistance protein B-like protein
MEKHPLYKYPEDEKVEYLCVVSSIASADGKVSDAEIAKIREFCKTVNLSASSIGRVISAAENPLEVNFDKIFKKISKSELRYTLLTDMIFLAFADTEYTAGEKNEIKQIAKKLDIKEEQLIAIEKYVQAILKANDSGNTRDDLKKLGGDVAAGLASAGIPIGAVAVSGSVFGLSAAGITSGLAALGLGLGMTTGIGVVAAIGVASYLSVRWVYKKSIGA